MDFIDWSAINWTDVMILAGLVFISALIGNLLNLAFGDNFIFGAILTALIFVAAYVGWNHYPHGIDLGQSGAATSSTSADTAP